MFPELGEELRRFREFGRPTVPTFTEARTRTGPPRLVDTFVNEFWTSRQRAAHSLHEISYRACFKRQVPLFFIERLTSPGETVYDPFMGRGTTLLEAALMGRVPAGCDVNPLSVVLTRARLDPPRPEEIADRLREVDFDGCDGLPEDLLVFYHPETLREICALREYLKARETTGGLDAADRWIRMVAVNRLTGHSTGFFSVYAMPPNQAVSVHSQRKINQRRGPSPPRRGVPDPILKPGATWPSRPGRCGAAESGSRRRSSPARWRRVWSRFSSWSTTSASPRRPTAGASTTAARAPTRTGRWCSGSETRDGSWETLAARHAGDRIPNTGDERQDDVFLLYPGYRLPHSACET